MRRATSKFEQIYEYLLEEIARRDVGDMLPCEMELAQKLCVNRMTVSKVMSSLKSQGLVSRKQGSGSTIIKKPSAVTTKGVIAMLPTANAASLSVEYFARLFGTVSDECARRGMVVTAVGCPVAGRHSSFEYGQLNELAESGRYIGVIVLDSKTAHIGEWRERYKCPEIPVVWTVMNHRYFPDINCVDIDNVGPSEKLVGHLFERGFRRIGFVSSDIDTVHRRDRFLGYKNALARLGLPFDERLVFMANGDLVEDCGYDAASQLARAEMAPDALFVSSLGLLDGMDRYEAAHPGSGILDLPTATFDYDFSGARKNVVASVRQPFEEMARASFEMLAELAGGGLAPPAEKILRSETITK